MSNHHNQDASAKGQPDEAADQEFLCWEADRRAALVIHRLVEALELAGPDRSRRIEPHLVWLIARNAAYHNLGASFLRFVRKAVAEGRTARQAEDKASMETGQTPLRPESDVEGHA